MNNNCFDDDKLLLAKLHDVIELSYKHCSEKYLGFLNELEARLISDNIYIEDYCFWGGYENATRVMLGCNTTEHTSFPIVALLFKYKDEFNLTHRDFLGALMSLGLERSTVGDILTNKGETIVFVKTEISDYIKQEISTVGRVGVQIDEVDAATIRFENKFDVLSLTLSSLRLDVFVSAVCNLSRDKSQRLIKSDAVSVNHYVIDNVSILLNVGDTITIRKFGKFVFTGESGLSKKGKHKITVNHFR